MVDKLVTVWLNGILVVDNVVMENYWDRSIPIFREGSIELQAHGSDLAFRDIYIKELSFENQFPDELEKKEGFVSLFDGNSLDNWIGNKTEFKAENGILTFYPKNGGHGNLFTEKEFGNFNFRFEFILTPEANSGIGFHAPLDGDIAYVGKEIQILDNNASIYKNLKPYQYHGSVYGIIAAKRDFLKAPGEWNYQEIIVDGKEIKVILNGETILLGNLDEAVKNGTIDKAAHPGLERTVGHIGILGHASEVKFRNIRIKEL
jgi:hypothetical protein